MQFPLHDQTQVTTPKVFGSIGFSPWQSHMFAGIKQNSMVVKNTYLCAILFHVCVPCSPVPMIHSTIAQGSHEWCKRAQQCRVSWDFMFSERNTHQPMSFGLCFLYYGKWGRIHHGKVATKRIAPSARSMRSNWSLSVILRAIKPLLARKLCGQCCRRSPPRCPMFWWLSTIDSVWKAVAAPAATIIL